jgi:hypothetical protein
MKFTVTATQTVIGVVPIKTVLFTLLLNNVYTTVN